MRTEFLLFQHLGSPLMWVFLDKHQEVFGLDLLSLAFLGSKQVSSGWNTRKVSYGKWELFHRLD